MFLGGKKGLGRSTRFVPIGDQKQFLSNSLWEGVLARAKKQFQENQCEGGDRGHPSPPSLGCSSRPHPAATCQADGAGGQTGSHHGSHSRGHWANRRISVFGDYFRNSDEKDSFLLSAHGAERGLLSSSVRETVGTPERSAFLRMTSPPKTAAPRPCRTRAVPGSPRLEACRRVTAISYDCH